MPRNIVIYDSHSLWDDEPIIVVVTGLNGPSRNPKTGPMLQTWILRRDVHPAVALDTGADKSICGDCDLRPKDGNRVCYVNIMGPSAVWRAFHDGKYDFVTPEEAGDICAGHKIRLGAYGDPAMVPADVWRSLIRKASGTTGYTHQWRTMDPALLDFCMASCDNTEDIRDAQAKGWRTFRCITSDQTLEPDEIICPASPEAGKLTTCDRCGLCSGAMADRSKPIPNIAITVHGGGAKHFVATCYSEKGVSAANTNKDRAVRQDD